MPTYEYKCRDCGERFDEFQKITDPPLTQCSLCGGGVERIISGGSGVMFKGAGFYINDYRSESYKKAAQKEKSDNSKSSTASSDKPAPDKPVSNDKKPST
jgi:putative FmdB family regulatory protein